MNYVNEDLRVSVWSGKTPQELCDVDYAIAHTVEPEDPGVYSMPYIQQALQWKQDPNRKPVADADINQFYADAVKELKALAAVDPELDEKEALGGLDAMWPELSEMLKEPAFYGWTKAYSMKSAFIFVYFVYLSGRSPALEMAMGNTWDIANHYRRIPECDSAGYYLRAAEPTFRSFTQRNWFSQQVALRKAVEFGWEYGREYVSGDETPQKPNLLFLGGGLLPQLRYYDLDIETAAKMFHIVVYDRDIDAKRCLEEIVGKAVEEIGIEWHSVDYHEALADEKNRGRFHVVLGTGIMSYCKTPEDETAVCEGAYAVLAPGGYYVCDFQVKEPSMIRCVLALRWRDTGLSPKESAEIAIEDMTKLSNNAGFVNLVCEKDIYNQLPAIVNFSMQKE